MIYNQKGLSLIEILVTIVIIGIVFTLLFQSTDFFTAASSKHDEQKQATEIVEQELNEALERLKEGNTVPDAYVVDQFLVTIHTSKLSEQIPQAASSLPHKVSMSGVYENESEPNLVIVTVSWGNKE